MTGPVDPPDPLRRLREALAAAWREALRGASPERLVALHREAREAARDVERLASATPDAAAALGDGTSAALEELENDARSFLRDASLAPDVAARAFALLRARCRLLRSTVRAVEGDGGADDTPFRLVELQEIENALRRESDPVVAPPDRPPEDEETVDADVRPETAPLRERVARVRLEILSRRAERQLSRAARVARDGANDETAAEVFRTFRGLDATEVRLSSRAEDVPEEERAPLVASSERLAAERGRLEDRFFEYVDRIESAAGLRIVEDLALELIGELDEARLTHVDARDLATIERLERQRRLGERMTRSFGRALRRLPDAERAVLEEADAGLYTPARVRRKLRRMSRRLKDLASDLRLARRLDAVFGRRLVERWEAMIFWLIVAVLGLIVVAHHSDPPAPGEVPWTVWADTAICSVLLLDFTVRWLLSPRRLDHLRRRFLTELVPSIPFGLVANLENVGGLQFVRLLRLGRVLRVLQLLRPAIRFFRLLLFVARASDRVVERHGWLLNHNIVFFTDAVKDERVPTLLKRARDLDAWIARAASESVASLPAAARCASAEARVALLEAEIEEVRPDDGRPAPSPRATSLLGAVRDFDVDDVIRTLRDLNPHRIAEYMGVDFARQVTSSLRFFRLPLLRRLPLVRYVVGPDGLGDPLGTTARLGRVLGDVLALSRRCVTWFADLYGSITGAQFLDRIGLQLVKATERPAKRLVLFSAILGVALLLVKTTRLELLDQVADALLRFLWGPVLILGLLCLVPLALGLWLRKIAGQAADFYDRVAEAQFLGLTETVKESCAEDYLRFLAQRVMLPEVRLRDGADPGVGDGLVDRFVRMGLDDPLVGRAAGREMIAFERAGFPHCASMFLFYRTFLDGAFFHANDTQIASLLLGNLTLENIRENRLRYDRKQRRRLERLDIGRGKGGVTGPYVWFNFITHSVSQLTARLILEYNRHCIPLDEMPAADGSDRELFQRWLEHRHRRSRLKRSGVHLREEDGAGEGDGTLLYRTTEFNALHFLTVDERRDEEVRERFGEMVLTLLREDREVLIRTIFGTFPMQRLPKERRTFNPYRFYRRWFARGRVFLSPLFAVGFAFKAARLLLSRFVMIVKDVLDPDRRTLRELPVRAGFDVARRKIHRMRRPVVMEAVRLRAEFDVQYLGVPLPGFELVGWEGNLLANDLRVLNASEREWQEFRELKSARRREVARLSELLRATGGIPEFVAEVVRRNPHLKDRERESMRAATTAFVCDHDRIASTLAARAALKERLERAEEAPVRRAPLFRAALRRRVTRDRVRQVLPLLVDDADGPDRDALVRSVASTLLRAGPAAEAELRTLATWLPPGCEDPAARAREILLSVAEQPSSWSEQLVAVRTVQSLGMMDLLGYERLIETLGAYEPEEKEAGEWRDEDALPRL
ncbi:MAG: hypothetical protein ACF8XB_09295 [Planctomycetota bacterium JB042]